MNSIVFKNKGIIDIKAITTFGISSKEGSNPIGFFGTGLKYAIAILLREGCEITIFSGKERYDFTTEKKTVRVNDFNFIQMNGVDLAFTTELGKTWELWQAYRELYCNCMDENGTVSKEDCPVTVNCSTTENNTIIVVTGVNFTKVHDNKSDFILTSKPIWSSKELEIHSGESQNLFYKGILVYKLNRPSKFTYNILEQIELTEDRTLKYFWSYITNIAETITKCNIPDILDSVLFTKQEDFEAQFDFNRESLKPCEEFLGYATKHTLNRTPGFSLTLRRYITHKFNLDEAMYERLELNKVQQMTLDKAINFCILLGYPVKDYKIVVVKTLGNNILGQAKNETIYLSERVFMLGTKMVTGTILEEYLHLKHHLHDESRDMQNYLFDLVISLGEQVHEISL